jgi:hypothetical protein
MVDYKVTQLIGFSQCMGKKQYQNIRDRLKKIFIKLLKINNLYYAFS